MSALRAEWIKLVSTPSPWWCSVLATVLVIGSTAAATVRPPLSAGGLLQAAPEVALQPGLAVVLVMVTLSVTAEYRFSTIRATFLGVPNRMVAVLSKAVVVAALAGVVGLVAAAGALGVSALLRGGTAVPVRELWGAAVGVAVVFAVAAVFALAVGLLVRRSAPAVVLVVVWALVVESTAVLPGVGERVAPWLPLANAERFLAGDAAPRTGAPAMLLGPGASLGYFAAVTTALLGVALLVAHRRDA